MDERKLELLARRVEALEDFVMNIALPRHFPGENGKPSEIELALSTAIRSLRDDYIGQKEGE